MILEHIQGVQSVLGPWGLIEVDTISYHSILSIVSYAIDGQSYLYWQMRLIR